MDKYELFVGGIPYHWNEPELSSHFPYNVGTEVSYGVNSKGEKRSRGFGFVTFRTKEEMQIALEKNDSIIDGDNGRKLKVKEYEKSKFGSEKRRISACH
jgi:RNA recognition motif-containing protein